MKLGRSKFQAADVFYVSRLTCAKEGDENGEPHRYLRCCNGNHKKDEHLRVVIGQPVRTNSEPRKRDKDKLAAFNINSRDMRMMIKFRRSMTPAKPIEKRMPLTMR